MSEKLKIAENINTPAEKLRELSNIKEPEILKAIALNPNTPPDLLVDLAGEYLDEIGFNPALDLILLENLNFIEDIYYKYFFYYEYEEVPPVIKLPNWFLKLGLDRSDSQIRNFIARNINTPATYLEKLATDTDNEVRRAVAINRNTPIHVLEKLATDKDNRVRQSLAFNQNNTIYVLEKLAKDRTARIRLAVANNPNINPKIIKLLFEDKNYNLNPKDRSQIQDAIELEIKRLNWIEERARQSLEEKWGQRYLYNLSNEQLLEFWQYLKSIESKNFPISLRRNVFKDLEYIPF